MGAKIWSPTECFDHYGVKPRNIQWSWSGKSEDGTTIAVRLWQDLFFYKGRRYRIQNVNPAYDYLRQPGLAEMMDNLEHAVLNCDAKVRVIVLKAKDVSAASRSIKECFPADKIVMRVSNIDRLSGTADLERVD